MKNWKRLLALLMALMMVFALAACDSKVESEDDEDDEKKTVQDAVPELSDDEDPKESDKEEDKKEDSDKQENEVTEALETEPAETEPPALSSADICGEWGARLDMTDMMNLILGEALGGMIEMPDEEIYFTAEFVFKENRECVLTLKLDADSLDAYMKGLCDSVVDMMVAMAEAEGKTREDLDAEAQAQFGMDFDEYLYATMEESMAESMEAYEDMVSEGYYTVEGNKLWISEDDIPDADDEDYAEIELEGDTLIFKSIPADMDILEEMEAFGVGFPWVFERQ